MRRSRRFLFLLLLCAAPAFGAELYYRSNELGMPLERIPSYRRHESVWVLAVEKAGDRDVRRLYEEGKEVRRWETRSIEGGAKKEERESEAGILSAYRVYSKTGELLLEELYGDGAVTQRSVFTYAGSRLVLQRVLAPDGASVYTKEYSYTPKGALRAVRRTGAGGESAVSIFVSGASGIAEERNAVEDALYVSRFDARGRIINRERKKADERTLREDFSFQTGSDLLESSTEKLPAEGKSIERSYDVKGLLTSENVVVGGKVVERIELSLDDQGKTVRKIRKTAAGLEEWRYSWSSEGKKEREEYRRRGLLEKATVFAPGSARTEELYRDGELFLKVRYEGDRRVKEEIYRGGKLLRERKFE